MKAPVCFALALRVLIASTGGATPPSVVYILCDHLGFGDVGCLNPKGKIPTPHLAALAAGGMVFTDVHSGSSLA